MSTQSTMEKEKPRPREWTCPGCEAVYMLTFDPAATKWPCPTCGYHEGNE